MFLSVEQLKAHTPSQRLQFALDALIEMEQSPLFRVDMGSYHLYSPKRNLCFACLGGAAAIKAVRGGFTEVVKWGCIGDAAREINQYNELLLFFQEFEYSLDEMARGCIGGYLSYFKIHNSPIKAGVCDYHDSPTDFKEDIKTVIQLLERYGL